MPTESVSPNDMRAVRLHEHGDADVLGVDEIDRPEPGEDELLLEVAAAGSTPSTPTSGTGRTNPFPFTPGVDVAGVVTDLGAEVEDFETGDRVYGTGIGNATEQGAYAEYATIPTDRVVHLPDGADLTEAGGAGVAAVTAWRALIDHADLEPAEYCLVHGGSGGGTRGRSDRKRRERARHHDGRRGVPRRSRGAGRRDGPRLRPGRPR